MPAQSMRKSTPNPKNTEDPSAVASSCTSVLLCFDFPRICILHTNTCSKVIYVNQYTHICVHTYIHVCVSMDVCIIKDRFTATRNTGFCPLQQHHASHLHEEHSHEQQSYCRQQHSVWKIQTHRHWRRICNLQSTEANTIVTPYSRRCVLQHSRYGCHAHIKQAPHLFGQSTTRTSTILCVYSFDVITSLGLFCCGGCFKRTRNPSLIE